MTSPEPNIRDWWGPGTSSATCRTQPELLAAAERLRETAYLVRDEDGGVAVAFGGAVYAAPEGRADRDLPLIGMLPPVYPEWLGDRGFGETHGCRFPYVVGEMARGIATAEMVVAAAQAGFMAFFGSAGLRVETIAENIDRIQATLGPGIRHWGANLIHSPQEPEAEQATVDLFLEKDVRCVSASAFMALAPSVVHYAASGLARDAGGRIRRRNHVFAKIDLKP